VREALYVVLVAIALSLVTSGRARPLAQAEG
jgi:hypothetical protein